MAPGGKDHPILRVQDAIRLGCDSIRVQGPLESLVRGIRSGFPLVEAVVTRVPHPHGRVPGETASSRRRQGRALLPAQHPLRGCFARIDAGGISFRPRPVCDIAAAPAAGGKDDGTDDEEDEEAPAAASDAGGDLTEREQAAFQEALQQWREDNTQKRRNLLGRQKTTAPAPTDEDLRKIRAQAKEAASAAGGEFESFMQGRREKYGEVMPGYKKKADGPHEPDYDDPDLFVDADDDAQEWLEEERKRANDSVERKARELRKMKASMRRYDILPKLNGVTVFSVTCNNEVVLVQGEMLPDEEKRRGGRRQLGLFFMRKKDAQDFLKKVKRANPLLPATVTETTLDEVVSLSDKTRGKEEVAWRIMPDHREVVNALTVSAMQGIQMQVDGVPLFQAQNLTVTAEDGTTLLPLFFTKNDLMEAWATVQKNVRQAEARSRADLSKALENPKVEVGTLEEIVRAMRTQVDVDAWSKVILIPPGSQYYQDELTGEDVRDREDEGGEAPKPKGWRRRPASQGKKAARAVKLDKKKGGTGEEGPQ